jgi:hypothetical protein
MLQRRLTRLEKKLKVPPEERHTSTGELQEAEVITVEGVRVCKKATNLHLDNTGRAVNKTPLQSAGESSLRWTPMSLKTPKISTVAPKGKDEVNYFILFYQIFSSFDHRVTVERKIGVEGKRRRRRQCRDTSSAALRENGLQRVRLFDCCQTYFLTSGLQISLRRTYSLHHLRATFLGHSVRGCTWRI